jgi:AraC-like DNA-binding protein
MAMIRSTCLLNFSELVSERGADPLPILRSAGVRSEDEGKYEVFITYRSVVLALNAASRATGDLDFGRRLALRQGIEIFGPVGVAARTALTMGAALETFKTYLAAYSPALGVTVETMPRSERTFFEFRILPEGLPPLAQVTELSLGIALQAFRFLMGGDYRPLQVHLPHDPLTVEADYREYFACTVLFGQRRAGFALRTVDLARALNHDHLAHQALVHYLDSIITTGGPGLTGPIRELVRQLLPTGALAMNLVADQLAVHPKTLQRRLAAEGATFAGLVEQVRAEVAQHYLRDTGMSLTQLAHELGYAEQSVLSRSCRRWFGRGPAAHRDALRAERGDATG